MAFSKTPERNIAVDADTDNNGSFLDEVLVPPTPEKLEFGDLSIIESTPTRRRTKLLYYSPNAGKMHLQKKKMTSTPATRKKSVQFNLPVSSSPMASNSETSFDYTLACSPAFADRSIDVCDYPNTTFVIGDDEKENTSSESGSGPLKMPIRISAIVQELSSSRATPQDAALPRSALKRTRSITATLSPAPRRPKQT